jgi:hypothetical protein
MYFTDMDEIKSDLQISFEDIINLKSELFQVELREGLNAQTESIDSFIEELTMRVKSPPVTAPRPSNELLI